jgi:pimeloyl-ACP methyl ester carboxylesterase
MPTLVTTFTSAHRGGAGPPMVCLHGFTGTWRAWDLVLPALERRHDVLAPTLPGHAGGPPVESRISRDPMADAVERMMDDAGFATAHLVGNSLGGHVAMQLATRGRAESVVALAPAGGWARDDDSWKQLLHDFAQWHRQLKAAAPHAEALLATPQGRRQATQLLTERFEHIPHELIAHQMLGTASARSAPELIEYALEGDWSIAAERIACPVRVVWGTADRLLPWPTAAARYRIEWVPQADWIELDGVGHCPQLDVPLETAQLILGFTSP